MCRMRQKAMKLERRQRIRRRPVSETTPSALTPIILAFARNHLGGDPVYIPVVDDSHGLYGWCSDGVQQKILADGGGPVFGWTIWEWPEVLLTAEFHAVWQNLDGDMVDITPKPGSETSILFVPDKSYPADFDFDQRPRNRRTRLFVCECLISLFANITASESVVQFRKECSLISLEDRLDL